MLSTEQEKGGECRLCTQHELQWQSEGLSWEEMHSLTF